MAHVLAGYSSIDAPEIADDALGEISMILEMRHNFSMSIYKDKCMKRRIAIRMRSCHCAEAADYCNLLRQSDQELEQLKKALTIHVSQFFRNPSMFELLQTRVIPELFQRSAAECTTLRVWSLGCAGGEEAYSVGILLQEHFNWQMLRTTVEINAADIDPDILQAAGRAEYNEDRLKELNSAIIGRYFIPNGQRMQLTAKIREMVKFHLLNIMDVALLGTCQLVLCRNTLIYFARAEQESILRGIAQILPSGGILVLGKSETLVGDVRRLFDTVCPIERIYRRI